MKYFTIFLLFFIVLITIVILGTHNDKIINFNYLISTKELHISTLFTIFFGIGFILGWSICIVSYLGLYISYINVKRKLKLLKNQFKNNNIKKLISKNTNSNE